MNKSQLIERVAKRLELPQSTVDDLFETTFEVMEEEFAKGGKVTLTGFGTFKTKVDKPRVIKVPTTTEQAELEYVRRINFGACDKVVARINRDATQEELKQEHERAQQKKEDRKRKLAQKQQQQLVESAPDIKTETETTKVEMETDFPLAA